MTQEEKKELAHHVLSTIAVTGFVAAAVIAPGIVQVGQMFLEGRRIPKRRLQPALTYAFKRRWISVDRRHNREQLVLTEVGKRRYAKTTFGPGTIKRPGQWDGKWRVVIFDIPNKRRLARDALRDTLRRMGFLQLQESVWIYPFPCERVIANLSILYEVERYVQVLLVARFDREPEFRLQFNLEEKPISRSSRK